MPNLFWQTSTPVTESLAAKFSAGLAKAQKLNLFGEAALANLISSTGLIVLGAGPYSKTSQPVLKACIKARFPNLGFGDDVESTQSVLALSGEAQKAGVPLYIGCGVSPGLRNVKAIDATSELGGHQKEHFISNKYIFHRP